VKENFVGVIGKSVRGRNIFKKRGSEYWEEKNRELIGGRIEEE
jgi:hypothetical protein